MLTAGLMLDPDNYQYFSKDETLKPKAFGDPTADKVIIQMTDGADIGCCYGHVNGDYNKQYQYLYKSDMDYQGALCTDLKKSFTNGGANVTIFSVIFDVDDGDYKDSKSQNIGGDQRDGGKWIKDVFKSCTSNPDQFYFDVPIDNDNESETQIEKVYKTIAQYFYKTRIVE
jgi:hypothetical protein